MKNIPNAVSPNPISAQAHRDAQHVSSAQSAAGKLRALRPAAAERAGAQRSAWTAGAQRRVVDALRESEAHAMVATPPRLETLTKRPRACPLLLAPSAPQARVAQRPPVNSSLPPQQGAFLQPSFSGGGGGGSSKQQRASRRLRWATIHFVSQRRARGTVDTGSEERVRSSAVAYRN